MSTTETTTPLETEITGAVRSVLYQKGIQFPLRYDLLLRNPVGLRRLAEVFGEGFEKYGADNWKKGFPESVMINHCMEHLRCHMSGDQSEDHLAHALWNLYALTYFQETKPELMDLTQQSWPPQKQS